MCKANRLHEKNRQTVRQKKANSETQKMLSFTSKLPFGCLVAVIASPSEVRCCATESRAAFCFVGDF
jgi:hypothetical protein